MRMKHFLAVGFAFLSVFLSVAPARADCLAAPKQDCVFDLAVDAALGREKLDSIATALLEVAGWQERAGSDRSAATVEQILEIVAAREADPAKQLEALNWAGLNAELGGAPAVAARMAEAVAAISVADTARRTQVEIRFLVSTGETARVEDMIRTADAGHQRDLALTACSELMRDGDFASAFDLGAIIGTEEFRADLDLTAVIILLRKDNIEAAEVAAAMTQDAGLRAEVYLRVAEKLASSGRGAEASRLLDRAEMLAANSDNAYLPVVFANVLARIGEPERALAWLAKSPTDKVSPGRLQEVRAVAALVAGDIDGLLAIVGQADRPATGGFWLKAAVQAWVWSGQDDIEPLLARLSPDQLPYALNALGLVTAEKGEVDAALLVLARLRGLGDAGRIHGDFLGELVRLLIQEGDVTTAVALAAEAGSPRLLSEIAAKLPR
jgi:hypothetical protein